MTSAISPVDPTELASLLEQSGFSSSEMPGSAIPALADYLALLMKWNTVMNLVGARSWQQATTTLIVDSFHLAAFLRTLDLPTEPECWDLGAGAGLPGIPLRMLWQDGNYTMVESREKRVLFLRTALAALKLPRTAVVRARVEDFFQTAAPADCIVSRAFMPWPGLLALVADRLAPNGRVILLTLEDLTGLTDLTAPAPTPAPIWRVAKRATYTVQGKNRCLIALERPHAA